MDANERRESAENVAIARVELIYPFAKQQLTELIASYPNLKEIVWVQEEPRNMGCWKVMRRRLPDLLPEGVTSATSAARPAPAPARATRSPTPASRSESSSPR